MCNQQFWIFPHSIIGYSLCAKNETAKIRSFKQNHESHIRRCKNVVNAIDELDLNARRIWCVAHRLHLIITDVLGFWKQKKSQDATIDEEPNIITTYD